MDTFDTQVPPEPAIQPPAPGDRDVISILWESAVQAFVQAILVSVLGSVAMGLVGGIWGEMTPSLPPALAHRPLPEAPETKVSTPSHVWPFFQQHRFGFIFFTLFGLQVWNRWRSLGASGEAATGTTQAHHIASRLSEDWFHLLVGNAFGALISAMVLSWVQQFSYGYWIRRWAIDSALGTVHNLISSVLGASGTNSLGSWFGWYGENQLKLTFWVLYLAAICDDLGIPNVKTLGRWAWRRFWKRTHCKNVYG